VAFISAYYEMIVAIERLRSKKRKRADAMLHIEAFLAVTEDPTPANPSDAFLKEKARLEKAIEEKKRELSTKRKNID